jgi:4a-hydroxytetrahydrobiopterin dehydratase
MARLKEDEIGERVASLSGWSRDGESIVKEFDCGDFLGSVEFVNHIAPIAEEMNHHPDLSISWNKVKVSLSTHSEGGITENDFTLATKIDSVA